MDGTLGDRLFGLMDDDYYDGDVGVYAADDDDNVWHIVIDVQQICGRRLDATVVHFCILPCSWQLI